MKRDYLRNPIRLLLLESQWGVKLENRIKSQHKEKNILNILKGLTLYRFLYIKHRSGKKSGHDFFCESRKIILLGRVSQLLLLDQENRREVSLSLRPFSILCLWKPVLEKEALGFVSVSLYCGRRKIEGVCLSARAQGWGNKKFESKGVNLSLH